MHKYTYLPTCWPLFYISASCSLSAIIPSDAIPNSVRIQALKPAPKRHIVMFCSIAWLPPAADAIRSWEIRVECGHFLEQRSSIVSARDDKIRYLLLGVLATKFTDDFLSPGEQWRPFSYRIIAFALGDLLWTIEFRILKNACVIKCYVITQYETCLNTKAVGIKSR